MIVEEYYDIRFERQYYTQLSSQRIIELLSSGIINFSTEVKTPQGDWVSFLKIEPILEKLLKNLMLFSSTNSTTSLFGNWYVKGIHSTWGPFSLLQMLEFYMQKRVMDDSLIHHFKFEDWSLLTDTPLFVPASLGVVLKEPTIREVVSRRKNPRIDYNNEVFVSCHGDLFRGLSVSLSLGGLGIITDHLTTMNINDPVNIIINSNNEHGAIQLKGRVVSSLKSVNFERMAIEFVGRNEFLKNYIEQRVPST